MTKYPLSFDVGRSLVSAIKSMPTDLAIVGLYTVGSTILLTSVSMPPPVRALVVSPLLLFVPGYVLVAAIYPGRCKPPADRDQAAPASTGVLGGRSGVRNPPSDVGLVPFERVVLSFGMTVVVLPIIGGFVWAAVGSVSGGHLLFGLAAFVLLLLSPAAARRTTLPEDVGFTVNPSLQLAAVRRWITAESPLTLMVNVLLVVGVVVTVSTLSYAFLVPAEGESYTTALLLTEQQDSYVAADYPDSFQPGEPRQLVVELTSHERRQMSYTVVVATERTAASGSDLEVLERNVLDRLHVTLDPGETVRIPSRVTPRMTGSRIRLSYYVYRGDAPDVPGPSSAYRHLYLWITVAEGS